MSEETSAAVEATVREIRRKTRKKYSAEEKVRIVLEGLRGEEKIAELCRREGIHQNMYYKWSKEFLEAGKQRLVGDTKREADSQEVDAMRSENEQLKAVVAELMLKNRNLKKSLLGCPSVLVRSASGTVVPNHLPPGCVFLLWDGDRAHASHGSLWGVS